MKAPQLVTCYDIKGNAYQVPADQLTFRPAVYGVIIQDEKILLSRQWEGYDFPGGGINLGESNQVALRREVYEETGLEVDVGRVLFANSSFFKMPEHGKNVHSIHMYYACEVTGGALSTAHFDEHEKQYAKMAEWVPIDRFSQLKFYTSADAGEILAAYKRNSQ